MVEAPLVGAVGAVGAPVVVLLPAGGGTPVPVPTGTTGVVWAAEVVWAGCWRCTEAALCCLEERNTCIHVRVSV